MALCMHGKQHVGEKHGTNITQSGYLQVVSVGVIGSSAEWGGGRIKAVEEGGDGMKRKEKVKIY